MSERTPEQIRLEIAAKRQLLDEDLSRLQSDVRSLALTVAAGVVVVGLLSLLVSKRRAAVTVWKLMR
jgi:hypothetical protein